MKSIRKISRRLGLMGVFLSVGLAGTAWAQLPSLSVRLSDGVASESGANPAVFYVSRTGSAEAPLDVRYSVGGTASNGVDYAPLSGRVVIPAGVSNVTVIVEPIDDLVPEPAETIILTLKTESAYSSAYPTSASATLLDDDNRAPAVQFVVPTNSARFIGPTNLVLQVRASDPDGWIRGVNFYNGNTLIGRAGYADYPASNSAPGGEALYSLVWSNVVGGQFLLRASASDNFNLTATSAPVAIVVESDPGIAVVKLVGTDVYASEPGLDRGAVTIYRTGNTSQAVTVFYHLGGTAVNGADYVALPGSLTLPAGIGSAMLTVQPLDDTGVEPVETVTITLAPDPAYFVADPRTALVYVRDNETNLPPVVALTAPENNAAFDEPVSLSVAATASDSDGNVVRVSFYSNGSLLGTDTNAPYAVSWANMPAGTYLLTARATDNMGAVAQSPPVTVTVTRMPQIRLSVTDAYAAEPGSDTATVLILRQANTNGELTVNYTVAGSATAGGDYEALSGQVTFYAGMTAIPVVIRPINDAIQELTENVVLNLASNPAYVVGVPRSAVVYLRDDEPNTPPSVEWIAPSNGASFTDPTSIYLSAQAQDLEGIVTRVSFYVNGSLLATDTNAPYTALWANMMQGEYVLTARATDNLGATAESAPVRVTVNRKPSVRLVVPDAYASEPGSDTAVVQIVRSYNTNLDLEVTYTLSGTASNGVDYAALPGRVVIPAGRTSVNISVEPRDDEISELTETVILTLAAQSAYGLAEPRTAYLSIRDNETNQPPTVALTGPAAGAELIDPTNLYLTAEAADADGTIVRVEFWANNLLVGSDTNTPFSVRWTGMASGVYQLFARATDNLGLTRSSTPVAVTVIWRPVVKLLATDTHGSEAGNDPAAFTVSRTENTNQGVVVRYAISGTASNGIDYAALPESVTLPAGVSSVTIPVQPLDDGNIAEPSVETLTLTLLPDAAYRMGVTTPATIYIYNLMPTNISPSVALVAPADNSAFTVPSTVTLRAEAADPDGTLARVEFLINGSVLGSVTSAPYTRTWSISAAGAFLLTARATDNRGAVSVSAPVRVQATFLTPPVATRHLPTGYVPGVKLLVPIGIAQQNGALDPYRVVERPPVDWVVSGVSSGGVYLPAEGCILFGPFTNASKVLTYELTPPPSATGTQLFSGVVSNARTNLPIQGLTALGPIPPHPADMAPADFVMTLDEAAAWTYAWMHFALPEIYTIGYAARAGYLWSRGEYYAVCTQYPTPQPPLVWVTQASDIPLPPSNAYTYTNFGIASSALPTNYQAGQPFPVNITVSPISTASVFVVEERLPSGWIASAISDQGVFSAARATIRWGLFMDGEPVTVSYVVWPPTNATTVGYFSGTVSFDGYNQTVSGVRRTTRIP